MTLVTGRDVDKMKCIVDTLFPTHQELENQVKTGVIDAILLFTYQELEISAKSLKSGKAPEPNGKAAEVIKTVAEKQPQLLMNRYKACLRMGVFPTS